LNHSFHNERTFLARARDSTEISAGASKTPFNNPKHSGEHKTEGNKRLKVATVDGCQPRAESNGDGGDHAIGQGAGAAARLIEKFSRMPGIVAEQWFLIGKERLRGDQIIRRQGPAEKFRPGDGRNSDGFRRLDPATELQVWRRADFDSINQEVGVEMNQGRL